MHKALLALTLGALLVAGCGGSGAPKAADPTPTTTTPTEPRDPLSNWSEGVRRHYEGANLAARNDPNAGVEERFHQPPFPPEAGIGETIVLTGSNIGVQVDVVVTGVETVQVDGKDYTAVNLTLMNNDGITILESGLSSAAVFYGDGAPVEVTKGVKAECSNGFDAIVRIDVTDSASGCMLFPARDGEQPARFQFALETVPTEAGGIWTLD